jgi:hypothetical protein
VISSQANNIVSIHLFLAEFLFLEEAKIILFSFLKLLLKEKTGIDIKKWISQHSTFINRQNIVIKLQRYFRIKQYCGWNGLIDIYRLFHPKTADYTFFPIGH